jgi:diguanylate cyclase (GGDEF)-like protein/PAS domain S-box-containing protein
MHSSSQVHTTQEKRRFRAGQTDIVRSASMRVSVIHSDNADAERPLRDLAQAHYRVRADVVLTLEQFMSLTAAMQPEKVAELIRKGATDGIETGDDSHLPAVVRHLLSAKKSDERCDRTEQKMRHSEGPYRALIENPHGICRCTLKGKLVDVNQALVTMLGCTSKEEVLPANLTREIIQDPFKRQQLLGNPGLTSRTDALEVVWKRKDGTALKATLSGREVIGANGRVRGYAIIAEDVTKQRELEQHLREQAAKDALTGLANDRSLMAALDGEIKRSKRTGREFALLLFALDDLKKVNDRYGPAVGNTALCRLADALSLGRRRIDTAARFGGDKFALVLPETPPEPAHLVSERIRHTLANDGQSPTLSVRVGVATYPKDGEEIAILLAAADVTPSRTKAKVHIIDRTRSAEV